MYYAVCLPLCKLIAFDDDDDFRLAKKKHTEDILTNRKINFINEI